jgi:type IV pilus assembly protein PilO
MRNTPWYGHLILALAIFIAAFFLYFKPQNQKITDLRAERIKTENEVLRLREQKKELDKIENEIVQMNAQLKELQAIIPDRKEIANILRQIQQLAYDSHLDVIRFAPQNEIGHDFYAEWPIPIQVTGNYNNLGAFFDKMSRFPRIFTINDFNIKSLAQQSEQATISADWTAKTYFFSDDASKQARPKR